MGYIKRKHSGGRFRHDPASKGIFIHGGTVGETFTRHGWANRFTLTLPSETLPDWAAHYIRNHTYPTFSRAFKAAVKFRRGFPALRASGIYACTDFIRESSCCGRHELQKVA